MYSIRIEHAVPNFEAWKQQGFDSDPLDRRGSGVKEYRVMRAINDPNYAVIDLLFETREEAELMLEKLETMWGKVKDGFGWQEMPKAMIVEEISAEKLQ